MLELSPIIRETLLQLYIFKKLSIENEKILYQVLKIFDNYEKNKKFFENVFSQEERIDIPNYKKVSGLLKKISVSDYLIEPSSSYSQIIKKFGAKNQVFSDFIEYYSAPNPTNAYHFFNLRMGYKKQEILRQSITQKNENDWALDYFCSGMSESSRGFEKLIGFHVLNGKITIKDDYSSFISFCSKLGFIDFGDGLSASLSKSDSFVAKWMESTSRKINKLNLENKFEEHYSSMVKDGNAAIDNILSLYSKPGNTLKIRGNFTPESVKQGTSFIVEASTPPRGSDLFSSCVPKKSQNSGKYNDLMKDFYPPEEIRYYDSSDNLYLGKFNFAHFLRRDSSYFNNLIHSKNDNSFGIFNSDYMTNRNPYMVHLKRKEEFVFYNNMDFEEGFKIFFGLTYPGLCSNEFFVKRKNDLAIFKDRLVDYNANLMFFLINQQSIIKNFSAYLLII